MTIMLLLVVLLFILVEMPMGILSLLSGVLRKQFQREIYIPAGDLFDMLTISYSSVNFVLYCGMSSQFRAEFNAVFIRCFKPTSSKNCRFITDANSTETTTNGEHLKLLGGSVKEELKETP